ncbi:MAG TPA: hypothetical protein VGS20_11460 [Candidatus Acidoferrales bacterium]|nr:hypothetical protein [Candidatus Acidoferrales bacterium]
MRKAFLSAFFLACLAASAPRAGRSVRAKGAPGVPGGTRRQSEASEIPATADDTAVQKFPLAAGWYIQSSAKVQATGEAISAPSFSVEGWYPAAVPSTVLAALVRDKVYPDPYFGMNLRSIPGADYPIGVNFSHLPMPAGSPFAVSWWYRTAFTMPAPPAQDGRIWLDFEGINYRANIWLNGRRIAASDAVAGTFRSYEFDVTGAALPGATNVLAVEVFPPGPADLALTWVDWNPAPPDKDMGLWRSVFLTTTGPVAVRNPHVVSELELPRRKIASLLVTATLRNAGDQPVEGVLRGTLPGAVFSQPVQLAPHELRRLAFTPALFPQLVIGRPRLWWPWEMGRQSLYHLALEFTANGAVSDRQAVDFGIRQVDSEINSRGAREFFINGVPLFIRGGGWAPDMMLRADPARTEAEIQYARDLGLNAIRLEGKLVDSHFFDLADRYGMLVMAGWCCCDQWENWRAWREEDRRIAAESLSSQIRRLRNHPSLLVWLNGSDNPPPAAVERMYLQILLSLDWPNPILSSATARRTEPTGATGVKMNGPYNWVPPNYWYLDEKAGGAWGFATEIGPGPAPLPARDFERMLPAGRLWPPNDAWNFHAGGGRYQTLDVFNQALAARYGAPQSLDDYLRKSQLMTYEGERAMFEAYARNRYRSTGVIQWMLQNAWPSLIWHLFDYYLQPAGGYFGARKANETLHIQYSYDDHSVVVSSRDQHSRRVTASATLYNFDMSVAFRDRQTLRLDPDSVAAFFTVPQPSGPGKTCFLDLSLRDASGREASRNFYWLSKAADASDFARAQTWWTPSTAYADFTALAALPPVRLAVTASVVREGGMRVVRVRLANRTPHLAFFVWLRVTGADGEAAAPVFWSDNDVSLLPGESRDLSARVPLSPLAGGASQLEVDGWNIAPVRIPLR